MTHPSNFFAIVNFENSESLVIIVTILYTVLWNYEEYWLQKRYGNYIETKERLQNQIHNSMSTYGNMKIWKLTESNNCGVYEKLKGRQDMHKYAYIIQLTQLYKLPCLLYISWVKFRIHRSFMKRFVIDHKKVKLWFSSFFKSYHRLCCPLDLASSKNQR